MKKIYLDTETIGLLEQFPDEDIIYQLSFILEMNDKYAILDDYCKPSSYKDMSIEAMEKTDITPEDIEEFPSIETTKAYLTLERLSKEECYLFAHNTKFDLEAIKRAGIDTFKFKIIDTLKIARFINDKLELLWDSCRLSYLYYKLGLYKKRKQLEEKIGLETKLSSHNSLYDAVDLKLLWDYLEETYKIDIEQAVDLSSKEILLTYMPSGKHKGTKLKDLDYNTLNWNAENSYDENVRYSCKKILGKD